MMVVSEIGEQWSPQTAPAMQADMERIIMLWSMPWKQATTIGIRIPKVPHEVPVAKLNPMAIMKMITGRNCRKFFAEPCTTPATNSFAPRLSVMAFRDHASVRIRMAGTICLKPSGRQSMHSLKLSTLRIR